VVGFAVGIRDEIEVKFRYCYENKSAVKEFWVVRVIAFPNIHETYLRAKVVLSPGLRSKPYTILSSKTCIFPR
jgi:hypothetical protein